MFCRIWVRSCEDARHRAWRAAYACCASPCQVCTSGAAERSRSSSWVCMLLTAFWMSALACCRAPKLTRSSPSLAIFSNPPRPVSERQAEAAAAVGDLAGGVGVGAVVLLAGDADRLGRLGQCLVEALEVGRVLLLDLLERLGAEALPGALESRELVHQRRQHRL